MKTIAVDGRCFTSKPSGIANFLINSIKAWLLEKNDIKFIILVNRAVDISVLIEFEGVSRVTFIEEPCAVFPRNGIFWFLFKLPRLVNKVQPDVFWAPNKHLPLFLPGSARSLVTVHDLVHLYYPQTQQNIDRLMDKIFLKRSLKNSDVLWCVSQQTSLDLNREFKLFKTESDSVVGSGIDTEVFAADPNRSRLKKKLLFVGTLEPRKNLEFLLSLMPRLESLGFELTIVGAKGWKNSEIANIAAQLNSVTFLGYVDKDDLVKLYQTSTMLVSPSKYEGFGLHLLEAMTCGLPVVAANNSSQTEVVANGGYLVSDWQDSQWIEAILEVTNRQKYYSTCAIKRAADFSWKKLINQIDKCLD